VSDYNFRFGGLERLYGAGSLDRLRQAHVAVIGIGGVGSWAAEALARSGIGSLTLVDLDEVCVSNVNRQLPAVDETIGRSKVEVMAERIRSIHPDCNLHPLLEFLT
jgi:tRNA A37 threonylcarbamoyladenosine dehydratase